MSQPPTARLALLAGGMALTLLAAGCGSSSGDDDSSGGVKGKTIALVGYGSSNPWGAYFNKVYKEELAGTGAKVTDLTTMDPGTQVQKFNQAVASKPDLIVVAILDTAGMVAPIQKAKQAGIPVLAAADRRTPRWPMTSCPCSRTTRSSVSSRHRTSSRGSRHRVESRAT